ncbi:MAG: CNNM domain-containing protein [Planctomycetota bacterium]|jgi:CBS domain containing-hemolysin-like protein
MSAVEIIVLVAVVLVGFLLSALYSGLETGFYTLNPVRVTVLAARGNPAAIALRRRLRHPARLLTVLLIGTNASNYLCTWGIAEIMHAAGIGDVTLIVLNALLVTPLLFIFAETLPKDLFRTHTDHWTYWLAPVITVSRWVFTVTGVLPLVSLFTAVMHRLLGGYGSGAVSARQRMSQLIREGVGSGVVTHLQARLTDRALAMNDQRVRQVMVAWPNVVTLPADAGREAREALIGARNFSRLPVVERGGEVIGVVSWVDAMLEPEADTRSLLDPPLFLTTDMDLLEGLALMRRKRAPMAIVRLPSGGRAVGLVTLKDMVEPLTGKLAAW